MSEVRVLNCVSTPSTADLHVMLNQALNAAIFRDDIFPFPVIDRLKAMKLQSHLENHLADK
jgi:hypothetical protein